MTREATIKEIQEYFSMTTIQLMADWKKLDDNEKQYFKTAVGEAMQLI